MRRSGLKIMASLLTLIGSFIYVVLLAILNGSIGNMFAISITLLGSIGVAKLLGGTIALSYTAIFSMIISFGVARGLLRYIEQYSNHYIAFKLLAVLRDKIFTALRKLCPAKLETKQKGSIISMITSDIETLEVFYAHTISPICIAFIVSLVVTLIIGFVANWYMALYAVFAYILIGAILPLINSKILRETGINYRKDFSTFNGYFMDSIKGCNDIILHGKQKEKINDVNIYSLKLLKSSKKLNKKTNSIQAFTGAVISILDLGMLGVGLALVFNGVIETPIMMVGVVALMSSFGPVISINALPNNLNQTFASGDRVLNLLSEKPVVEDITKGNDFDFENLKIENLDFGYNKENNILNNVNIDIKKGQIVGVVGHSGCGKSTLLKLLLRFWKKDDGKILYNNVDIENINSESLKNNVTMVSQTTYLFNDTIKNNLLIANKNATDKEIEEACKKASIYDLIMSQNNGFDTKIGTSGVDFSAGEKQRLGLARAFLSNAKLILLDEPTSNVDSINEGIILKSLAKNKSDKAIILVSHRESTMSIADKVYKINGGAICE